MPRTRRLMWPILGAVLIASILNLKADSIDVWLLGKIERDEEQLTWALRGENGYSVELLPSASRWSAPLFLEQPSLSGSWDVGTEYIAELGDYFAKERKSGHLAGGYLYLVTFSDGSALYSLSAEGARKWFSPIFNREVEIAPRKVWAGAPGADFSYATILSGVPPRLVLFDGNGEVKEEHRFDLSDPDLASKIQDAANQYSSAGEPTLEMVSLSEYLREENPSWRSVEITSAFNFRNQHKRPEEIERIEEIQKLTRDEAKGELRSRLGQREVADQPSNPKVETEALRTPGLASDPPPSQPETTLRNEETETPTWPLILGAIAVLCVAVILFRAFLRGRTKIKI